MTDHPLTDDMIEENFTPEYGYYESDSILGVSEINLGFNCNDLRAAYDLGREDRQEQLEQSINELNGVLSLTEQRLPKNYIDPYIDPSLSSRDQELLRIFYAACLSEGGSADEVTLRGIRAVIDWQLKKVNEFFNDYRKTIMEANPGYIPSLTELLSLMNQALRPQQENNND